eukprot:TRINITY_DN11736_c0_g3_i1.p1 TRINITY_DN11736_c0_g3~~TRINITY_DN11736_c0_g3_i1.p1  ORF type:complete len:166 (-),score=26.44 TRINITY_DN11736_c0_g3_i1:34-531(-)
MSGTLLNHRIRNHERKIRLFKNDLVSGINFAVLSMRAREVSYFRMSPQYHYRESKAEDLLFKIELLKYTNPKTPLAANDFDSRINRLQISREKGNLAFGRGEWEAAVREYKEGLKLFENMPKALRNSENWPKLQAMQLTLQSNMAQAYIGPVSYTHLTLPTIYSV